MAYKLAVEDIVCVTVKGKLPGATKGAVKTFDFTIDMRRDEQEELNAAMASGAAIADFIVERASAWAKQRLVLNEDGSPAEFCEAALREMMKIPGMAVFIYRAYLNDVGVQEKN